MIKKVAPIILAVLLITAIIIALRIGGSSVVSNENETQQATKVVVDNQTQSETQTQAQSESKKGASNQETGAVNGVTQDDNAKKSKKKSKKMSVSSTEKKEEPKEQVSSGSSIYYDGSNYYGLPSIDLTNWKYPDSINAMKAKIQSLRSTFPEGYYWNHMNDAYDESAELNPYHVTTIPCEHWEYGELYCNEYNGRSTEGYLLWDTSTQCMGFGSLLSDLTFGEQAPVLTYGNYDGIRIGDQARIYDGSHTVFIIDKNDEYITVAECNGDYETCMIKWDVIYYRWELDDAWYLTRWEN